MRKIFLLPIAFLLSSSVFAAALNPAPVHVNPFGTLSPNSSGSSSSGGYGNYTTVLAVGSVSAAAADGAAAGSLGGPAGAAVGLALGGVLAWGVSTFDASSIGFGPTSPTSSASANLHPTPYPYAGGSASATSTITPPSDMAKTPIPFTDSKGGKNYACIGAVCVLPNGANGVNPNVFTDKTYQVFDSPYGTAIPFYGFSGNYSPEVIQACNALIAAQHYSVTVTVMNPPIVSAYPISCLTWDGDHSSLLPLEATNFRTITVGSYPSDGRCTFRPATGAATGYTPDPMDPDCSSSSVPSLPVGKPVQADNPPGTMPYTFTPTSSGGIDFGLPLPPLVVGPTEQAKGGSVNISCNTGMASCTVTSTQDYPDSMTNPVSPPPAVLPTSTTVSPAQVLPGAVAGTGTGTGTGATVPPITCTDLSNCDWVKGTDFNKQFEKIGDGAYVSKTGFDQLKDSLNSGKPDSSKFSSPFQNLVGKWFPSGGNCANAILDFPIAGSVLHVDFTSGCSAYAPIVNWFFWGLVVLLVWRTALSIANTDTETVSIK